MCVVVGQTMHVEKFGFVTTNVVSHLQCWNTVLNSGHWLGSLLAYTSTTIHLPDMKVTSCDVNMMFCWNVCTVYYVDKCECISGLQRCKLSTSWQLGWNWILSVITSIAISVLVLVKLAGFTVNEACLRFCLTVFNFISLISASVFSVQSPAAIRGLYYVTANANQTIHSSCCFKLKAFDCYWEAITGNKICLVSSKQDLTPKITFCQKHIIFVMLSVSAAPIFTLFSMPNLIRLCDKVRQLVLRHNFWLRLFCALLCGLSILIL